MALPVTPEVAPRPAAEDRVNVLVVDDRPAKLLAMDALLSELGENIICVASGADALRQVLERDFAVVLLDVNMPDMDGLETAALIRQRPRSRHVPIIFMTAGSDETNALAGYSLGAVDYIMTPLVPEVLRTKVRVFAELFRKNEELKRQADQRVALADERAARAAAEERSRLAAFLAEAGKAMARSLDMDSTIGAILDALVPGLAAGALLRVDMAEGEPLQAERRRDTLVGPSAAPVLEDAMERTARLRATELIETETAPGVRALAGLACPLVARGGVLGALGVAIRPPRPGNQLGIISLVEELGGRAAMAIDNCLLYRQIEQRDLRKDAFVAMLAHELRNPLAALTSALDVLETPDGRDDMDRRARQVMGRQLKALTRLADDLLDVARVTTGRITLDRSPVNLAESVERCLAAMTSMGTADGYDISLEVKEVWVHADPMRLEQILANLIGNAFKYTPPGNRIALRVRPEGCLGVFEVEDTGAGMTPEVAARAFELFFQADQTLDRAQSGLGIGLALVRQLVELHGGSVDGMSAGPGLGSRFIARLPQARPEPRREAAGGGVTELSRRRIAVVEDNRDAREMLRILLTLGGHEVYEADSGPTGLEIIREFEPDIALVDVGLPGFDGYELARRLRSTPDAPQTLLIAVTGYGQPEARSRALEAGFDVHIVKPVDHEQLKAIIASAGSGRTENANGSR